MKNTISNHFITFRVPNDIKERIEHYAQQDWVSTSDICRRGIKRELQELSTKYDAPDRPKTWGLHDAK